MTSWNDLIINKELAVINAIKVLIKNCCKEITRDKPDRAYLAIKSNGDLEISKDNSNIDRFVISELPIGMIDFTAVTFRTFIQFSNKETIAAVIDILKINYPGFDIDMQMNDGIKSIVAATPYAEEVFGNYLNAARRKVYEMEVEKFRKRFEGKNSCK